MAKDKLFLLKPNFMDKSDGPFYCPGCAKVEGALSIYPELRDHLDIRQVDFPRPRPAIIAEVGEENQDAPVLVLAGKPQISGEFKVKQHKDRYFISGADDIMLYLSAAHGVGSPHL